MQAFVQLVLDHRYDAIRTTDLIAASGVGRSTFYEHFRSKDDVLLAAIDPLLLPLANAVVGRGAKAQLNVMLDHLWQQRALGRIILDSRATLKLQRKLALMIEVRLEENDGSTVPPAMRAMFASAGLLAMLRMWIAGEASSSSDALARQMIAFSPLFARDSHGDAIPRISR